MSFGWSAGDILAAIKFIVEVANALDATDGAAKEFREASTFLRDIKSALTPLQTFTALDTRPNYKADIERQVEAIKVPIEKFVEEVRGLQNGLGVVKEGRLRHLQNIPSKLKWHFYVSKRSLALQKEVGQHLQVIDALMRQLTIDMIDVLQSNLKGDVEKSLEDRLNVHLPVLQTKLLAELSERDISAQATWQVQLENLLESYLGHQRVTLPSYTAEEERRPTQVTSNSILYRGSILRVNVSHLQARRSDSILEQYSHQMTGITTDTNVIWKIQNWWRSEKAEFVCVQCEPSQLLERSIGSDIAALGRAANVNVITHSCQRINSGGMAHSPTEEFINLVYGMIYELCNNWQEDFSTFRDLSKARFMLLDYTPDSIPSALELLRDLLSLMSGRCLIVIERMDILDNSNDLAVEMHLKSLFALLRSKEGIACLKTFITTESYSRMIVDEVREENYVDASLDNDSAGFLSLTEFEAGINAKGSE